MEELAGNRTVDPFHVWPWLEDALSAGRWFVAPNKGHAFGSHHVQEIRQWNSIPVFSGPFLRRNDCGNCPGKVFLQKDDRRCIVAAVMTNLQECCAGGER